MAQSTLEATFAPMGAGKSYMRGPVFLVDEFLPNQRGRVHISNIPIRVDVLADFIARKKRLKVSRSEVRTRVFRLCPDLVASWKEGIQEATEYELARGPWDAFGDSMRGLCKVVRAAQTECPKGWSDEGFAVGVHLAIDEAHLMIPKSGHAQNRKRWKNFVKELRHRHWTLELITQDPQGLDREVSNVIEIRYQIRNMEKTRDPILRIQSADWYELKAKFLTGEWNPVLQQTEERKALKGWSTESVRYKELRRDYYELYNSWSRPQEDGGEGDGGAGDSPYQFDKMGALELLGWFWRRNYVSLIRTSVIAGVLIWLCFLGGFRLLFVDYGIDYLKAAVTSEAGELQNDAKGNTHRQAKAGTAQAATVGTGAHSGMGQSTGAGVEPLQDRIDSLEFPVEGSGKVTLIFDGELVELDGGEVLDLAAEVMALRAYRVRIRKELDRRRGAYPRPVAFFGDTVVFANGERLRPGDEFISPEYIGQGLESVDLLNREARLFDGTVVRLGGEEVAPGDEFLEPRDFIDGALFKRGIIDDKYFQKSGGNGGGPE